MDNNPLVVGSKDCPLKTIILIVRQSSPVFLENWSTLARELDIPSARIKKFKQDLLLDKITHEDLIVDVLEIWIAHNGSNATLANLLQVVEKQCGANDVGELLRLEYKLPCKLPNGNSIEWKDLPPAFQKRVIETFQHFTLNPKHEEILPKLSGAALVSLMRGKKPHILSLLDELSYYVSRTIVIRNIISDKIFDQDSPDIFLFTGIDRYELSKLAKDKPIGSSEQQSQFGPNVKFIVLEEESHFEKICEKTNHPVHLLRKEGKGKLRWVKSKEGMNSLRKCIDQEQDELDEEQFCKTCDSQSLPVLIFDTQGMGKSTLLAHIGHRLVLSHPERTVLFIELGELIKTARSFEMDDKLKMIELTLQTLTGYALQEFKLNSDEETVSIELLLDGYDEVDLGDRKLALQILQTITNSIKSIRLWITSQPHLRDELENSLNILGYNIRPFTDENQVQFLSSFWSRNPGLDQGKLRLFAKHCLKSLKKAKGSTDNDIVGIPLQCLLIGEVYKNDAVQHAKPGKHNFSTTAFQIEIKSIADMYFALVKIKFDKYKSEFGSVKFEELMIMHGHLSQKLLFPDFWRLAKALETDIGEVRKVGLIISTRMGEDTFMHRTFAEYFVAMFVIGILRLEEEWTPTQMGLFFSIMERLEYPTIPNYQRQTTFAHPRICYFINSMLDNLQKESFPNHFPSELHGRQLELMKTLPWACVAGNFLHIFKLFDSRHAFDKLSGNFFNLDLLLNGVRNSSVELLKSVLIHYERRHDFNLEVHEALIREAVKKGKFLILEFLINEKGLRGIVEDWKDNSNLVCDCVEETMDSSEEEIREKIQVLQMLVDIKGSLLDSLNGSSATTPILSQQVHVELLIKLVQLGANVFVQNEAGDTVLHKWHNNNTRPLDVGDYNILLMSISTDHLKKLVHVQNFLNETPLMSILKRFDPLPETLDIFHNAGADLGHVNEEAESVLTVAVKYGRNLETIRKLVHLGA